MTVVASFLGCGNGRPTLSGIITLDGKPLGATEGVRVTIMFYPEGGGAPAGALADANGRYILSTGQQEGIAEGRYVAIISATESTPSASPGGEPQKRVITPARYADPKQSGLAVDVKPGSNTFDLKLESGP